MGAVALEKDLCALVDYAARAGLVDWSDRLWAYNAVLEAVGVAGPGPDASWVLAENVNKNASTGVDAGAPLDLEATLSRLAEASVEAGRAEDTASGRDRAAMRVMGVLTPRPSQVATRFDELCHEQGPRAATSWFYRLCCDAGYVRRAAIAKNIAWNAPTHWGDLQITINLSKPEKDPRDIAAAGQARDTGEKYPACQLCIENEGYPGRGGAAAGGAHPARQNLRIVPMELDGERYGLQYSPYAYFNEHCIVMSARHRPMHIDRASLACLFDFVDLLPHYFIGSNADLPIVGGSILSHDHFQGGDHEFPVMRAKVTERFSLRGFPDVEAYVLQWPLSVLRLRSGRREDLLEACVHVIDAWHGWSDETVGVRAHSADGTPHNTVTPVIRRVDEAGHAGGERYEAYLALRCNVTSEEHPLGVFHPHAQWHHIKKENIGLIEVMGLAILPPRLVDELAAVRAHLLADDLDALESDPLCASHAPWARKVAAAHPELSEENAQTILRDETGQVFGHVLEDAGVFKWDDDGRAALDRFLATL